jgi:hypothetical protein
MMVVSSLWGILIVEDLLNIPKNLKSDYKIVNFFLKMFRCPLCVSAHIFWISYIIMFGSLLGFYLCPIVYYLTYLIKKYLLNVF